MERRNMLGRGLFAGLTGLFVAPAAAAAAPAAGGDDTSGAAAAAIDRVRALLERNSDPTELGSSRTIDAIRLQQRQFLIANRKYPDFIEIGLGVWEDIYDWHVKHQQPITATRLADGRYTIAFMFTTLVLRPDQDPTYVGFAFDAEPVRRQ
jgi:hypothetical protein